jgi:tRNA (guanine-N7-)-methyltransferase
MASILPLPLPVDDPRVALRVPRAKTRLHVNPLSPELMQPPSVPRWPELLADSSLPLALDLGCGYGELALQLSLRMPEINFVGVDLRGRPLLRAQAVAQSLRLRNTAFLFANCAHPLFVDTLLSSYAGPLATVSCLFPDPYARAHKDRRLLKPALVAALTERMACGAVFVTATDNAELAAEMRAPFEADSHWTERECNGSPFPVATAWESTIRGRSSPIYWSCHRRV